MRKKCGILVLIGVLCAFGLCGIACSNGRRSPNGGGSNQLDSVKADTIRFSETTTSFSVSWDLVKNAQQYEFKCGSFSTITDFAAINLRAVAGFTMPANGEITVTIIAKGSGYKDSKPVSKTHKTEGVQLRSPEIISFDNGVIKWSADSNNTSFILKVNNAFVSDGGSDNLYHSTSYDVGALTSSTQIDITAIGDGVWVKDSATTTFMYNAAEGTLNMLPVSGYVLDGEVLRWNASGGATGYKVVDLDFNVTTVTENYYDLSAKNIVYGVYPVTDSSIIQSAEIAPVSIRYLSGNGTASDPYLIKTPMDLRAIDYYEARYAELGGNRNHYRIENDIDYNVVNALESDSNIFTLRKPFFGTLDGNGKKLSNIRVHYDGGYWALFDFLAAGSTVKNIVFESPEISNKPQDTIHPLNPAISMIAYRNYGTVTEITLNNAAFTATTGEIGGIVSHNFGTVSACTVSGTLVQSSTAEYGSAQYEMAGVVLENCRGGIVDGNTVKTLTIRGTGANIRSAAGVVAINRAGGIVRNNSFESVTITGMTTGSEYGGVTAYSAGTTTKGTGTLGTFVCSGSVTEEDGTTGDGRGKLVGKRG